MRLVRYLAATLAALLLSIGSNAALASHPGDSTGNFYSEGCNGTGTSHGLIGYPVTETVSSFGNSCGWYYLSCSWVVGSNVYAGCVGWKNSPNTTASPYGFSTRGVYATHSLCNAGGTCGAAVYRGTSYIHP